MSHPTCHGSGEPLGSTKALDPPREGYNLVGPQSWLPGAPWSLSAIPGPLSRVG